MLFREGLAKPPRAVPAGMLSPEGLAKSPGAVPSATPPPPEIVVRDVYNGRAKSAVHFACSADVPVTCSADVLAATRTPMERRRNKLLERRRNKNFRTSQDHPPSSVRGRGCRRGMICSKLRPHHPRTLPPQPRPYGHARTLCRLWQPQLHPQFHPPINLLGLLRPLQLNRHKWPPQHRPSRSTPTRTTTPTRTRRTRAK